MVLLQLKQYVFGQRIGAQTWLDIKFYDSKVAMETLKLDLVTTETLPCPWHTSTNTLKVVG